MFKSCLHKYAAKYPKWTCETTNLAVSSVIVEFKFQVHWRETYFEWSYPLRNYQEEEQDLRESIRNTLEDIQLFRRPSREGISMIQLNMHTLVQFQIFKIDTNLKDLKPEAMTKILEDVILKTPSLKNSKIPNISILF